MKSGLYIVATPIGNLGDISQRAIDTLRQADLIAAEDTRHTQKLLAHLGIQKDLISLHDHNERQKAESVIQKISEGLRVALVSDAGTPLISDPGYILVREARDAGLDVIPVPGSCAIIAALSASGMPAARFAFEGFLPAKTKSRQAALEPLVDSTYTHIYYESTHRILDSLKDFDLVIPERKLVIARELTKTFETFLTGSPSFLRELLISDPNQQKGEFVLIVEPASKPEAEVVIEGGVKKMLLRLAEELPPKKAASIVSDLTGANKKQLYDLLVK